MPRAHRQAATPRAPGPRSRVLANLANLAVLLSVFSGTCSAFAAPATILWGVSDSGMEFGRGLKAGTNYAIPDPAYYLSLGLTLIRLPMQLDRLAPKPGGPLDPAFLAAVQRIVARDEQAGAITVLDLHGFGFLNESDGPKDILKDATARHDYLTLVKQLAGAFRGRCVAIGLMNEPHTGADLDYAPLWNDALSVVRQAGFAGPVLVPHAHWSAASDISPAAPYGGRIVDPARNWVLELHLYLDPDDTGTYRRAVASPDIGVARLAGAIAWARQSKVRIFLGETGGPADPIALAALSRLLESVDAAPDAMWGVALWGAGPWWKPNYPMHLDPVAGIMRPQTQRLAMMAHPQMIYVAKEAGAADAALRLTIDGHQVVGPVSVSVDRFTGVQAVPLDVQARPGVHDVHVEIEGSPQETVYLLGASWKSCPDSADAFRMIGKSGITVHLRLLDDQAEGSHPCASP